MGEGVLMRPFHRFGLDHWFGLVSSVLVGKATAEWGRRAPRQVEYFFAIATVAYIVEAYRMRWDDLTLATGLPLHLCDLLLFLALLLLYRAPREMNNRHYEWLFIGACGGTSWALITPDIEFGFPHWRYFEFFFCHALIFWILAHLGQNRGGQVCRGAAWRSFKALCLYTLVVGSLDFLFGWNYGYLREKPSAGSVLDFFGPWPTYVLVGLVLSGLLYRALEELGIWLTKPDDRATAGKP